MTSGMEVFEIERIVQRLICGMAPIFAGSYLVLHYKHDAAGEKYGIRSFAHSRNRELKEKLTSRNRRCEEFQLFDLMQPRIALP